MGKLNYIIGMADERNNFYVVTDLFGKVEDTLVVVNKKELKSVSKSYLFPYHTFNKEYEIKNFGFRWAVLKVILMVEDNYNVSYSPNSATEEAVEILFLEEIRHGISLANVIINNMFKSGDFLNAIGVRKKILEEQIYFPIYSKGDISSYSKLLNYENPDPSILKLIRKDYSFPLTLHNLYKYEQLVNMNILIDYSIIPENKHPFGLNGKAYLHWSYLEKLPMSSIVSLYSNLSPGLFDWESECLNNKEFILECVRQKNVPLIILAFESNSVYTIKEIKNEIDGDELFELIHEYFSCFLKKSNTIEQDEYSHVLQASALFNILSVITSKSSALIVEKFDADRVAELITLGGNDYIAKLMSLTNPNNEE